MQVSSTTRQPVSNNPQPARRKYTSRACEECRRRRVKCSGQRPSCTRCEEQGSVCQYSTAEDRRKPAPKTYVDQLRRRIHILEDVLLAHSINLQPIHQSTDDHGQGSVRDESSIPIPSLNHQSSAFEGALALEESLNYEHDGEFRYFGPTSGRLEFRFHQDPRRGNSSPPLGSALTVPDPPIQPPRDQMKHRFLQAEDDYGVSHELKETLIDLFFTWQNPWCRVVDETLFRESREKQGRYHSPLLEKSILAIGSRFIDDPVVRTDPDDPNTAGRVFFDSAEVLLYYDLKRPSLTTIQSLLILNNINVGIGADAAGWLHQGMAYRLALDMGLNLDAARLGASSLLTNQEMELRRKLYWTLYVDDKLSAIYTGRICTVLDFQGNVHLPTIPEANSPTTDSLMLKERVISRIQNALIGIAKILEHCLVSLYAPQPRCEDGQRQTFFDSCGLQLSAWIYDLSPELRLDRPNTSEPLLPQIYTMHMVYHTTCILLAKPFLPARADHVDGKDSMPAPQPCDGELNTTENAAVSMMYNGAKQICTVARKYRRTFGSFRQSPLSATHCTLSAIVALLHISRRPYGLSVSRDDIDLCLCVLKELSKSWDTARRIHANLVRLIENPHAASSTIPNDKQTRKTVALHNTLSPSADIQLAPNAKLSDEGRCVSSQAQPEYTVQDFSLAEVGLNQSLESLLHDDFLVSNLAGDDFDWNFD